MRIEDFIEAVKDLLIIPDYVIFQMLGRNQAAKNLIHRWCKQGRLIRIKKGMYVLSERYRKPSPFLLYHIANNLLSPSYISLDTALSYYGLIPERIVEITSVNFKRPKRFTNKLGTFSYRKLSPQAYAPGVRVEGKEGESFLIAEREKAILDKIYFFHSERYFQVSYLFDSLRIEKEDLSDLNFEMLDRYAAAYPTKKMKAVAGKMRGHYGA